MQSFNEWFRYTFNTIGRDYKKHPIKIIDIGGVPDYWKYLNFDYFDHSHITTLNMKSYEVPSDISGKVVSVKGTAINMSEYDDNTFDLAFSNSVIEHVGDYENQKKMAEEMRRIATHGYLQTPNRYFFMEPHFLVPFFQFLPVRVREELVYRFRLGHYPKATTRDEARIMVDYVHLLTEANLRSLFPNAEVFREKYKGFTKSFILRW